MLTFDFSPFPRLETTRLILRPLEERDLDALFKLRTDSVVSRYIDRSIDIQPDDIMAFIHKIAKGLSKNLWVYWAITKKDEDLLIGTVCFWNLVHSDAKAELGYELSSAAQGKGYMSETLKAVLSYGFGPMGLLSVEAGVHPDNHASLMLLERTGFKPSGTFKDTFLTGDLIEMKIFALQKDAWERRLNALAK